MTTNGIRLFCLEAGPPDGPCVLLLHGFPELAYAWRQQVAALGAAGYHVIAPDLPGYGRSDKPDVTYDCDWIDACLMGVVDAMGAQQVVIAGHDWGGLLVWIMARQYPDRVAGVIGVNTPDLPRTPMPPVQLFRQIFADTPIYIIQFQERGAGRVGARHVGPRHRRLPRDDLRRGHHEERGRVHRARCSTCTRTRSARRAR